LKIAWHASARRKEADLIPKSREATIENSLARQCQEERCRCNPWSSEGTNEKNLSDLTGYSFVPSGLIPEHSLLIPGLPSRAILINPFGI
jgi:hypothetical protein